MNYYNNYYQQPATQVPYHYQLNEVLYPDYHSYPTSQDISSAYQVYNYDPYSYVPNNQQGYHVYKPNTASNMQTVETVQVQESADLQTILKKNPKVWEAYKTGNFDVEEIIENGTRRIILKEKSKSSKDYEYTVKKYKVSVHNSKHHVKKGQEVDDHLLLVSYSSNSLNNTNQSQQKVISHAASPAISYNPVVVEQKPQQQQVIQYQPMPQPQQVIQYQQPAAQYHLQPQCIQQPQQQQIIYQELPQTQSVVHQTTSGNSYYQPSFSGPGSDLIQKIIDGDDEDFEYVVPEVHELVGNYLVYPKQNKARTETPKKLLQAEVSVFSDDESYDQDDTRPTRSRSSSSSSVQSRTRSDSRGTERSESKASRVTSDIRSDSRNSDVSNNSRPIIRVNKTDDSIDSGRNNNSRLSALNYSPGVDSVQSPVYEKKYTSKRK